MKVVIIIFALVASLIRASGVSYLYGPSGKRFVLIENSVTFEDAEALCEKIGGRLAEVIVDDDFHLLSSSSAFSRPAWIKSFQGKSHHDNCMAFFSGGSIAVPMGNCKSTQYVLCEL